MMRYCVSYVVGVGVNIGGKPVYVPKWPMTSARTFLKSYLRSTGDRRTVVNLATGSNGSSPTAPLARHAALPSQWYLSWFGKVRLSLVAMVLSLAACLSEKCPLKTEPSVRRWLARPIPHAVDMENYNTNNSTYS